MSLWYWALPDAEQVRVAGCCACYIYRLRLYDNTKTYKSAHLKVIDWGWRDGSLAKSLLLLQRTWLITNSGPRGSSALTDTEWNIYMYIECKTLIHIKYF